MKWKRSNKLYTKSMLLLKYFNEVLWSINKLMKSIIYITKLKDERFIKILYFIKKNQYRYDYLSEVWIIYTLVSLIFDKLN